MLESYSFEKKHLQGILDLLNQFFQCIGPTVRDGALVFTELNKLSQLPRGYSDRQQAGQYHLDFNSESSDYFSVINGPQGIKPWLFKPQEKLWQMAKDGHHVHFNTCLKETKPIAFLGARACDLAALKLQDQHFLEGQFIDPYYAHHRQDLFIAAINCHRSSDTCFCVSTGDGPEVKQDFDWLLTELENHFILASGSPSGDQLLTELLHKIPLQSVSNEQLKDKEQRLHQASQQVRHLPDKPIAQLLTHRLNHKQWNAIAERCLACGNCTMVCPSCFCHSEYDEPALNLDSSEHFRQWDSCFTTQHSYIAGYTFRRETRQQYRQWLTHKFSFWHEQYGRSGCSGCGRCISWCPVGIDITEELAVLCQEDSCYVD